MYYTKYTYSYSFLEKRSGVYTERSQSDAWGRPRDPITWSYNTGMAFGGAGFGITMRGYTMQASPERSRREHLEMFSLINMNGRMYDPILGRMLSPDNYIQAPDNTQSYNRYSYCINNPLKYTDPSGEIFWAPIIVGALLLTTEVGYDIQKAVSPVAFHVDLSFGSHGNGIGLDVSIGVPQTFPINYRYDVGATYYFNRVGGYGSGWQLRNGGEWGIGLPLFQVQYSGMRYRDYNSNGDKMADQVVHTMQIGNPLLNLSYSNDTDGSFPWAEYIPLIPELEKGSDRYRTASGRARIGLFDVGFFLHTGEGKSVEWVDTNGDGIPDTRAFTMGNIDDANRSNGIIYVGFGPIKMGWDSEGMRNALQNRFAHDWITGGNNGNRYPYVLPFNRDPRFVFQFGGF
jgi:RHS repeat-associated protein